MTNKRLNITKIIVISGILLIAIVAIFIAYCKFNIMRVHFIDVDYGDSILVQFPKNKTLLIDAGSKEYGEVVYDYLLHQDVKTIDTIIITHPQKDHFGGIFSLIGRIPIKKVFINGDPRSDEGYDDLLKILVSHNIPIDQIKRGQRVPTDTTEPQVFILNPIDLSSNINGNALVTVAIFKETGFLFTSDIQPKQQNEIIETFKDNLSKVECIQVPHHGGKISKEFADFFDGKIFIASTGKNDWGRPDENELSKLQGTILRTDRDGSIVFKTDGIKIKHVK